MRFPVTIRHRASKAKIYAPAGRFAYYRVAYATAGKRRMQTFAAYSDAKTAAERIVRELANGSQAAALSASHAPLLGAACHGCLLVPETSCEQRNEFLDRALVVSTVEACGAEFFPAP